VYAGSIHGLLDRNDKTPSLWPVGYSTSAVGFGQATPLACRQRRPTLSPGRGNLYFGAVGGPSAQPPPSATHLLHGPTAQRRQPVPRFTRVPSRSSFPLRRCKPSPWPAATRPARQARQNLHRQTCRAATADLQPGWGNPTPRRQNRETSSASNLVDDLLPRTNGSLPDNQFNGVHRVYPRSPRPRR